MTRAIDVIEGRADESKEQWTDRAFRKRMDRGEHAGTSEESPEDNQRIGQDHEDHVPVFEQAALFLDHHGMQKGRASQPGHEGRDFNRVPAPVPTPAENIICPASAEHETEGQEQPCP